MSARIPGLLLFVLSSIVFDVRVALGQSGGYVSPRNRANQGYAAPGSQGYSAPTHQGYAAPRSQGYNAPPHQGYAAPSSQGYNAPGHQGYAAPGSQGYNAPTHQGYAAPRSQGYSSRTGQGYSAPNHQGYRSPSGSGFSGLLGVGGLANPTPLGAGVAVVRQGVRLRNQLTYGDWRGRRYSSPRAR